MSKLLVVDDSMVERGLVGGLLEKESGFAVEYADNGRSALQKLESGGFDLVVTDLRMPEMNGLELVDEVRRRIESRDRVGGGLFTKSMRRA